MKPARPPSRRLSRVAELLKREVSDLVRRELSIEQVGLLNVHEVRVAPDLKNATVLLGFVGTAAQRKNAPARLEEHASRIQAMLGSQLKLKWTPVLRFLLDDAVEQGDRVLTILKELEENEVSPSSESSPSASPSDGPGETSSGSPPGSGG